MIAYNGEVYNHSDLRSQLATQSWRGHSDTETVVAWLEARGVGGLAELNGIFSLAWVDPARSQLVLARDPFGVKPLYYSVVGNRLVAASELAPLRMLLRDEVEPEHVALLLRLRFLPSPYTLYRNIRKLVPGNILSVDLSGPDLTARVVPFTSAEPPERLSLSFSDARDRYLHLLRRAVSRQMMADTEVGVLLSGGLDSAVVARLAKDSAAGRLRAFTVGFEGQYPENEIIDAQATAANLGLECQTRVVTLTDFLLSLRDVVRIVEEPLATTSIVPMHFLARLASDHVKVVLSGQGADEPLGGYVRYQGMLIADFVPSELAPLAAWLARMLGIRSQQALRGLETASWPDGRDRLLAAWQVFSPDEIESLTGVRERLAGDVVAKAWNLWPCSDGTPLAARMMRLDARLNLADDLLTYTDRLTMRESLECRVPFLDHELMAFLESIPLSYKLRLSGGKRIHKEAAAVLLPSEIVHRRKRGFDVPTRLWFRDTGRVKRLFADEGGALGKYVDPQAIDNVLEQHSAGFNRERQIFLLLTLAFALGADPS